MNKGQFLYTVNIFENLYGIEITSNKISKYPIGSDGMAVKTILNCIKNRV